MLKGIRNMTKPRIKYWIVILIGSLLLLYMLISFYFKKHFFFNTVINGVDFSLKTYKDAENKLRNVMKDYELLLLGRNGETEVINGPDIELQFNEKNSIPKIINHQKALLWFRSISQNQCYYVMDVYTYQKDKLDRVIKDLIFVKRPAEEPKNVSFQYVGGSFEMIEEVYGNKIDEEKLREKIITYLLRGNRRLNLEEEYCYEYPEYTIYSYKSLITLNLLNKYTATTVKYKFGDKYEILDGKEINKWIKIDNNLDVSINEKAVKNYVNRLSKLYDTVGIPRQFKASTGKVVEVEGGLYGWKINQAEEVKALMEIVIHGNAIEREPIYSQKALFRGENEIGNTYVEINITRQYLWFYKDGKLIAHGPVVTGNPNRGHATVVGVYMLNYKQKDAILVGPGYESDVTYWMPFYGSIGLHDASWRHSFGGTIYKRNGSHGCVNAPLHLARKVFEVIEPGDLIISYEE
ncbi:MAG: hypothetical protein E7255_02210 [Lachnospiraceae bacterium]|nr:hypothetical protein [Lachnospiraceae bacterium]